MSKDLYKILGIPQTATEKDIRAAYRTLPKKYHPDAGAGSLEDRFREIQCAGSHRAVQSRDRQGAGGFRRTTRSLKVAAQNALLGRR